MRAHQGVRDNEERLRMAMSVANIAAWEWHLPTGRMTWSADPETLFGFPPISKHLVELHGGRIDAVSAGSGKGATFVVQLPNTMSRDSSPGEQTST
jgi:hypothetical protein